MKRKFSLDKSTHHPMQKKKDKNRKKNTYKLGILYEEKF